LLAAEWGDSHQEELFILENNAPENERTGIIIGIQPAR
jgi:hypothetical protein